MKTNKLTSFLSSSFHRVIQRGPRGNHIHRRSRSLRNLDILQWGISLSHLYSRGIHCLYYNVQCTHLLSAPEGGQSSTFKTVPYTDTFEEIFCKNQVVPLLPRCVNMKRTVGNCLPMALTPPAPSKLIILDLYPVSGLTVGTSQLLALFHTTVALFQPNWPTLAILLQPLKHNYVIFQLLDYLQSNNSASFVTKVTRQQTECHVNRGRVHAS